MNTGCASGAVLVIKTFRNLYAHILDSCVVADTIMRACSRKFHSLCNYNEQHEPCEIPNLST